MNTRRSLLKALGIAPGLLPLLDADVGRAAERPKRFIVIAVPNGVRADVYWPTGGETNWEIKAENPLGPLLPHKQDIIFLGGIRLKNGHDSTGKGLGGHAALPFLLTGKRGVKGPRISDGIELSAGGPSLDVFLAKEMAKQRGPANPFRFESLALVPFRHLDNYNDGYLSFFGPPIGGAIPNVASQRHDPIELYGDIFGTGAGAEELAKLRAQRKSVLAFVGGYLGYMSRRLGTEDRRKLEAHAEGVRRIELTLAPPSEACKPIPAPTGTLDSTVVNANPNVPAIVKAQIDLTVAAMACDMTRVASMLWQDSSNVRWVWSWLGADFTKPGRDFANAGENMGLRNHHEIAHRDGETEFTPLMNRCCRWYVEQFAYLIERLKATPDAGGGTMFDNTVILFANLQRTGGGHQTDNLPWIVAGSGGGYLKTGRFLPWPSGKQGTDVPQNGILAAIANAVGVPVPYFGDADYGGELSILRG